MAGFFDILKEPPVQYPGEEFPLFNRISIETISYCNRSCHFCPCAWNDRGKTHMTDELFDKIGTELGELGFDGVAQLFLLSEPYIDKTLNDKSARLRGWIPDASFYISTNGDVLDSLAKRNVEAMLEAVEKSFLAGINVININSYDAGNEQLDRYGYYFQLIQDKLGARVTDHKYRHHNPKGRFVCLTDMRFGERDDAESRTKGTDVFYIRNKQDREAFALQGGKAPQLHCMRTQRHIVALFDGKVPICCAIDPNDEATIVGNLNTQSIKEIWNSDVFFQYRYFTQQGKRVLPHCSTCTHKMAFPHVVRKVTAEPDVIDRWSKDIVP